MRLFVVGGVGARGVPMVRRSKFAQVCPRFSTVERQSHHLGTPMPARLEDYQQLVGPWRASEALTEPSGDTEEQAFSLPGSDQAPPKSGGNSKKRPTGRSACSRGAAGRVLD